MSNTPATPSDKIDWEDPVSTRRLRKDLRARSKLLDREEARGLIETYYMLQGDRIRTGNRIAALQRGVSVDQPPLVLSMFNNELQHLEELMKPPIEAYVKSQRAGRWLLSLKGIGPILAGACLAHIDVRKARSAGAVQRFAGVDPTLEWNRGERRPFNADLKKTMWLIADSFVKVKNREGAYYGAYYAERKAQEEHRNETGLNAEAAARYLAKRTARDAPDAEWAEILSSGKLPPFLVDKRARRKVINLFINHLYEVMHECEYGKPPEWRPYVIDVLGHKNYLTVPGWPIA